MKPRRLDGIITALILVRLGQELGTDGPLARAIHELLTALVRVVK